MESESELIEHRYNNNGFESEQIHNFTIGTEDTFVIRNRFEKKIFDWMPEQYKRKMKNSDNIIKFRQGLYRFLMVLIIILFCMIIILYNREYIQYYIMLHIVKSDNAWMYNPELEDLETRSIEKSSNFQLRTINTTEGLLRLRKKSQYISDQFLIDTNIPDKNITFSSIFNAHERLIKQNDLECVCSPMYNEKYRFLSFNSTNNMIIHTINAKLTGPPSSVERIEYMKTKVPKGNVDINDIRLIDSEYFILPGERREICTKFLDSDSKLPETERPRYNIITFDPMIDIPKFEIYNTYTVEVLFPSYISIEYISWRHQYHPADRNKVSTMIIDDKSSACVENCLLLFEGISPFDISFH